MINWLQSGKKFFWVSLLMLAMFAGWSAKSSEISYPSAPDWVREIPWDYASTPAIDQKSSGTRLIVYESQDRPKAAEQFTRVVELMENENGVQDSGSLRLGFDAEFQEMQIHRVVVHRGGQAINRLNTAKVRVIQQENELAGHMLTGHKTAVLFIEDLRVGDILEYAWTVKGANPVLGGHYSTRFFTEGSSPVSREIFRVVWDDKNPLRQRLHGTPAPEVKKTERGEEYNWNFTNVPAVTYEDRQPGEFEPYSFVEVSDFADWAGVVNWALPLYEASPGNEPTELQTLIARWESTAKSDEEKARLALQFVQDDLRYTGIELGPDSYRPANPLETFEKRFGDCKGKVVLLRLLLAKMGIKSYPALVNAYNQAAVAKRLPTPFAFNHVILQMQLGGQILWVDPTLSHQGGTLFDRHIPPYGQALVIAPGNDSLIQVPRDRPQSASNQKVSATFLVKDYSQPATLSIRTEYSGASADRMRDDVASTPAADLAKNYLNFYVRLYSSIAITAPLKFTDNRTANKFIQEEFYVITNLWERQDKERIWTAEFHADNLYNVLTDPQTRLRKTPLALGYPLTRQQHIVVNLPDADWQISEIRTNIEHQAFSYSYHRRLHGKILELDHECHTKLATVPVEMVPGYLAALDQMEALLSDVLHRPDASADGGINWLMVLIALFGFAATLIACIWYWRHSKAALPSLPPVLEEPGLQGLGGWLILVGIGLCLGPLVRVVTLGTSWQSYFGLDVWQSVATPGGESYHALYPPLLMLEMLGNVTLIVVNIFAIVLFFTKRRIFPQVYIVMMMSNAVFLLLDDFGCSLIPSIRNSADSAGHKDAIRAVLSALIWCSYMVKSRRVKATFIR
jgi:transglutaminase-like putative cysteine protease